MSELEPINGQTIFSAVLGALVSVLAWLGKRLHHRVDQTISREEFNDILKEMREDRARMHDENRETLSRIHDRVDDLWKNTYQR